MNSYLYLDHSGKTLKRISRSIIRRLAVSFSVSINSRLDYIGMGSLFYEDFKEFYPSGCIDSMISIECMTDAEGNFDDIKYRRFMLNRPYEQIRIMPMTVSKAVAQIPFDKPFLIWLDYDCTISRETIEDIAEVIRRASAPGMLVSSTGAQIASKYIAERHTLDMENIRYAFTDMLTAETTTTLDDITWDSFTESIRDAATPYYQNVVSEKNAAESRNYRLFKAGRVEHRQPSQRLSSLCELYARYSDDIIMFQKSREDAEKNMQMLLDEISKHHLCPHEDSKTGIYEPGKAFDFLGFTFDGNDVDIAGTSLKKLKRRMRIRAKRIGLDKTGRFRTPEEKAVHTLCNKR